MRASTVCAFVLVVAALTLRAAVAGAQATPDLSGTWTLDASKSDAAAVAQAARGGRGGATPAMVITQAADEITVQRGNQTFTYKTDGSEMPGPPGGETKSTMSWQNGGLVVVWKREFFAGAALGYQTSSGRDVYTLGGATLTVERTVTNARGDGATQTLKSVYSKS
jgi:hypothetical protein